MPCLKKCCCCYDLRPATLAIGVMSMVMIGFFEIGVAIYCLLHIEESKKRIKFENTILLGILEEDSDAAVWVFFSILILVAVIYIFVCILMIHGVRHKKRFLLLPWAMYTLMNMVMAFSGGILMLINSHGYALNIIVGIIVLVISTVWIYFTFVVFSFFRALQNGEYW